MVVLAGRAAHGLGEVLGADGVDPVVPHPFAHQLLQVRPEGVPLGAGEVAARAVRVDAVAEEDLGPVDVADARDDLLVHQQGGDAGAAAGDPLPGALPVLVAAQRVRAQALVYRALLGLGDQGAGGGAAQVGVVLRVDEAQPDGVGGRRGRGGAEAELAEEAEVDVDPAGGAEAEEEVLAVGVRGGEGASVQEGRAVGELALRTAHPDRCASEPFGVVVGEAADGVSLGHGGLLLMT